MNNNNHRPRKVGQQIQKEIALILQREITAIKRGIVTVSGVKVSANLGHATIFITFLAQYITDAKRNDTLQIQEVMTILQDSSSYIRMLLAKAMRLRIVPELRFCHDNSLSNAIDLCKLTERAIVNDQAKQYAD